MNKTEIFDEMRGIKSLEKKRVYRECCILKTRESNGLKTKIPLCLSVCECREKTALSKLKPLFYLMGQKICVAQFVDYFVFGPDRVGSVQSYILKGIFHVKIYLSSSTYTPNLQMEFILTFSFLKLLSKKFQFFID